MVLRGEVICQCPSAQDCIWTKGAFRGSSLPTETCRRLTTIVCASMQNLLVISGSHNDVRLKKGLQIHGIDILILYILEHPPPFERSVRPCYTWISRVYRIVGQYLLNLFHCWRCRHIVRTMRRSTSCHY